MISLIIYCWNTLKSNIRADSRFAPSQWETMLQSNAVSSVKMCVYIIFEYWSNAFSSKFCKKIFLGIQITINQHWFRKWLGTKRHHSITWTNDDLVQWPINVSPGGCFKNAYELLNLRALKFSPANSMYIFQCINKIFCVEFQRVPLKFLTKYLAHSFYTTSQFFLDFLRAHKRFWNAPLAPAHQSADYIVWFMWEFAIPSNGLKGDSFWPLFIYNLITTIT